MKTKPRAALVFAAGFGTRMGKLTRNRPKPLIRVADRPMLDHALDLVSEVEPDVTVVNTHYLSDQIADHLSDRNIVISHEPSILDTGGGLKNALPHMGRDPVFTLNSDAIWSGPNPLIILNETWQPTRMDALLMCVPIANARGHSGSGDFSLAGDGRIDRGSGHVFGGAQIINPAILDSIDDTAFSLNVAWDRIATSGRLFGTSYPGLWCDVGHPAGIETAERLLGAPDV